MSVPKDAQAARELVREISKGHGYLDEGKLHNVDPGLRREIEEAFLRKDNMIGSSVITLAKNLYTSKARFIFELLQNADDNKYTHAAASGSLPFISFQVHPRQIIIDCNQDGFTSDNLKAICDVGNSSKKGAEGYIGEKGIGFKSVFMAAWKTHVHSGAFSFSFTHKPGDSGMGMISPVWEDTQEELEHPLTRITLHLHDTGDEEMLAKTRDAIVEQFKDLQETVLLFMRNLREIHVSFYNDNGDSEVSTSYSIDRPRLNYAILRRVLTSDDTVAEDVKYFHVTTYQAKNLARNENRTYSEIEESTKAYSNSQVVLAFPLSNTDVPITKLQDIFVSLPVRAAGFNFIIQADFVTDASRQDIVKDSLRNIGLLDAIACAFAQAALQFCEIEKMRYQWMRYLPSREDEKMDKFWRSLTDKIAHRLGEESVLFCHKKNDLHFIQDLRTLPDWLRLNDQPLFDDGDTEKVVSESYTQEDLEILQNYGLRVPFFEEIIEWIQQDLNAGRLSRMKSASTSDEWHAQAVKVLQLPFDKPWDMSIAELTQLDLLPLEDGRWVSITSGPVYFSQARGVDIPSDINLQVISKDVTDIDRLRLFKALGAKSASVSLVRKAILRRYTLDKNPTVLPLEVSKGHLEFLYLTQHMMGEDEPLYERLSMHGHQDGRLSIYRPCETYMYITDKTDPYGPWELLRETDPGPSPGDGATGYRGACFVDEAYFKSSPARPPAQPLTWVEWIHENLDVERYLVFTPTKSGLWEGGANYLQTARPEKMLGALRIHFQHDPELTEEFIQCLEQTEVLCRGNVRALLVEAYFPIQRLEKLVEQYVEPDAAFPWLWLHEEATYEIIPPHWKDMFTTYCVGFVEDFDFALQMLKCSLNVFSDNTRKFTPSSRTRLFGLYRHIQAKYRKTGNKQAAKDTLRDIFSEGNHIYIPIHGDQHVWADLNQCVWNAPREMKTKFVLRLLYERTCALDKTDFTYLESFFTETLGIGDCTWQMYINELQELKRTDCEDIDTITVIYKELTTLESSIVTVGEKEEFRAAFDKDALIFVPSDDGGSWYTSTQCVWSTAASLRGKVSLNHAYEDLESFFVTSLDVKPIDLHMAIDELEEVASRAELLPVQEVKDTIRTVNSLLATETKLPPPGSVLKRRIFPIKYPGGEVRCESRNTEFFVVDREPLKRSFEGEVKLLDFTLDEVVQLRPFLRWTCLEERYLSVCVKEVTSFCGSDARPISDPDRKIRYRAHALLRIAFQFNSPRTTSAQGKTALYEILRNVKVYETDGVTSNLLLSQDGKSHVVERKTTALHFEANGTDLKIYVPADKDDQDYMFAKALPERLFQWLMTHPASRVTEEADEKGAAAARDIILTPRSRITRALEDCGIRTVSIANIDEVAGDDSTLEE